MKRLTAVLAVLCMVFFLASCTGEPVPSDDASVWEPEVPDTIDLTALLLKEDVETALGVSVGEGVLQEHDTVWSFMTADYTTQVSLMAEKPEIASADYLTALTAQYPEGALIAAPKIGVSAYWCSESRELLVDTGRYVVSVIVNSSRNDDEYCLLSARALALCVLERL